MAELVDARDLKSLAHRGVRVRLPLRVLVMLMERVMCEYMKGKVCKATAVEQADGYSGSKYHRLLKRVKRRKERRRAKADPECLPGYGRYYGYEL